MARTTPCMKSRVEIFEEFNRRRDNIYNVDSRKWTAIKILTRMAVGVELTPEMESFIRINFETPRRSEEAPKEDQEESQVEKDLSQVEEDLAVDAVKKLSFQDDTQDHAASVSFEDEKKGKPADLSSFTEAHLGDFASVDLFADVDKPEEDEYSFEPHQELVSDNEEPPQEEASESLLPPQYFQDEDPKPSTSAAARMLDYGDQEPGTSGTSDQKKKKAGNTPKRPRRSTRSQRRHPIEYVDSNDEQEDLCIPSPSKPRKTSANSKATSTQAQDGEDAQAQVGEDDQPEDDQADVGEDDQAQAQAQEQDAPAQLLLVHPAAAGPPPLAPAPALSPIHQPGQQDERRDAWLQANPQNTYIPKSLNVWSEEKFQMELQKRKESAARKKRINKKLKNL